MGMFLIITSPCFDALHPDVILNNIRMFFICDTCFLITLKVTFIFVEEYYFGYSIYTLRAKSSDCL